jgi:hypothetical protein
MTTKTRKSSRSVTPKRCVTCGRKFRPTRRDARYCSGRCRQSAARARSKFDVLDREIENTRLRYWQLIAEKARALGRRPSQILTDSECQYVDQDGNVWMGGVLGGGGWRLAGRTRPHRGGGFSGWGLEAVGPPWAPPASARGHCEGVILGRSRRRPTEPSRAVTVAAGAAGVEIVGVA